MQLRAAQDERDSNNPARVQGLFQGAGAPNTQGEAETAGHDLPGEEKANGATNCSLTLP